MVYIGFDNIETLTYYDWFHTLPDKIKLSMSNMHYAIPIDRVASMAKSIEQNGSTSEGGVMMKVLGHPIAQLQPNESIVFIEQLRNGKNVAKVQLDRHFPVNPSYLELFFNLQENDVLRVSLDSYSKQHPYPPVSVIYDVNVSTGQITQQLGKKQ